ncbi:alpha-amylase family glycosyl hydrolase [Aliagarivorans taiwanensis]|uniref:alpha-amylase family glycosyl hydrolase n=1 Tax=Aliagarivorans taiwanensis TaxID=561966 RepID=UPI0003F639F8|nr:alpha-amylase family glycosyl hydrolase [Aliagarivorans taiwanensis]
MNTSKQGIAGLLLATLVGCGGSSSGGEAPPFIEGEAENLVDMSAVAVDDQPGMPANWYQGATFMEIYVRGYKDSSGDGIGDINGLIEQLDYLQDLGIGGIWLLPINQSSDNDHGYEVTDYRAIERDFGSREDFDRLISEAHQRGIGIIIDYVLNHSSGQHPVFIDSDNNAGNKRDWYVWRNTQPTNWGGPWYSPTPWHPGQSGYYYGWFQSNMPEFNFRNSQVVDFHHNNLRYWLNAAVDGFRFDATSHLVENGPGDGQFGQPENQDVMFAVKQVVREDYQNRYMLCEDSSASIAAAQDDACAFYLNAELMAAAKNGGPFSQSLISWLQSPSLSRMGLLLSNHDAFAGDRVYEQLDGDIERYKLASASLLTLPGQPFIYYGEEIGMGHNSQGGDWGLRTPMSWTAEGGFSESESLFREPASNRAEFNVADQIGDPESLHSHYKALIQLRKQSPALRYGELQLLSHSGNSLAFLRVHEQQQVLVVLNYGSSAQSLSLELGQANTALLALSGFGQDGLSTNASGILSINQPAYGVGIYQLGE